MSNLKVWAFAALFFGLAGCGGGGASTPSGTSGGTTGGTTTTGTTTGGTTTGGTTTGGTTTGGTTTGCTTTGGTTTGGTSTTGTTTGTDTGGTTAGTTGTTTTGTTTTTGGTTTGSTSTTGSTTGTTTTGSTSTSGTTTTGTTSTSGTTTTGGTSTTGTTGGGGGGDPFPTGNIQGTVYVPTNQLTGRGPTDLTALGLATVNLRLASDNSFVATTNTDSLGRYAFPTVNASTQYIVSAAKVLLDGATIHAYATMKTGVSLASPVTCDLDDTTTCGADAAQLQLSNLVATDSLATIEDMAGLSDQFEAKYLAVGSTPPDMTSLSAIRAASQQLVTSVTPDGSYVGTISGLPGTNFSGRVGALVKNNQFTFVIFDELELNQVSVSNPALDNATNSTAFADVTDNGILSAQTLDGQADIVGVFAGNYGQGQWRLGSARARFSLTKVSGSGQGVFMGTFTGDDHLAGGHAIVMVDSQNAACVSFMDSFSGLRVIGTGSVSGGSLSYDWADSFAQKGSSTGSLSGDVFSGTYVAGSDDSMPWTASRLFFPF
ncbi:MAG: hypothetical protein K8R88_11880 [Armatimonadetes bacterium]|nr:hypothetical protein [Armatimonadota bacterium]